MLTITTLVLGPVQTNTYIVADGSRGDAVVIDPAWEGLSVRKLILSRGWRIGGVWVTHAHFDHIGGIGSLVKGYLPSPSLALHPADRVLWEHQGGAGLFGMFIDPPLPPTLDLYHGQKLTVGDYEFEVRCLPGHTPGHVVFYCAGETIVFSGDTILRGNIGRTDLPGGDYDDLIRNIQEQILSLPDKTRLFCGHGPETTVGIERIYNPYLA